MNFASIGGCLFFVAQVLWGQSVVALPDRQEILVEGHVLRRTPVNPTFVPVPDLPELRPSLRFLGHVDSAWDGAKVYQVGLTEDHHRVVCVGRPSFTREGEYRWSWDEPKVLPLFWEDGYTLLGGWEDSLLFLKLHREAKTHTESIQTQKDPITAQTLIRIDLLTGEATSLMDVQTGDDIRSTALFSQDAFYLFTATGKAVRVRVRTEPWSVDLLSSKYWSEAGVTMCKDTGEFQNPFLFGKAFLDPDGSILIPSQVFLPLDRQDIDRAWSKMPQSQKAELISSGFWPVPVDKEIGWKSDVRFLKLDPSTATFSQVDRPHFEHLVVEEDRNFIVHRFRVHEPTIVFTSDGSRILPLEEAMRVVKKAPPATTPNSKNQPTAPASTPGLVGSIKGH